MFVIVFRKWCKHVSQVYVCIYFICSEIRITYKTNTLSWRKRRFPRCDISHKYANAVYLRKWDFMFSFFFYCCFRLPLRSKMHRIYTPISSSYYTISILPTFFGCSLKVSNEIFNYNSQKHLLHYNDRFALIPGLYLYILVVKTFTGESIKLRIYVAIGWGEFANLQFQIFSRQYLSRWTVQFSWYQKPNLVPFSI